LPSENSLDKDKVRKTGSRTRLSGQTNKGWTQLTRQRLRRQEDQWVNKRFGSARSSRRTLASWLRQSEIQNESLFLSLGGKLTVEFSTVNSTLTWRGKSHNVTWDKPSPFWLSFANTGVALSERGLFATVHFLRLWLSNVWTKSWLLLQLQPLLRFFVWILIFLSKHRGCGPA
jgi:hypothetical protein